MWPCDMLMCKSSNMYYIFSNMEDIERINHIVQAFVVWTHWPLENVIVIFKFISKINILSIFCESALRWEPQNLIND